MSSDIVKEIENLEIFSIGDLVTINDKCGAVFGTSPELWKPWKPGKISKTITIADNIQIPKNTLGVIIGYVGHYHTILYTVMWLNLGENQTIDLVVPTGKLKKTD